MATALKYEPENLCGLALSDLPIDVYAVNDENGVVLTEIIAANTDSAARSLTITWQSSGNPVALMHEVPIAANSLVNLNLYLLLPLAAKVTAVASVDNTIHLTMNGLVLKPVGV